MLTAIAGGLIAAVLWGVSGIAGARASASTHPSVVAAWMLGLEAVVLVPVIVHGGPRAPLSAWALAALAGAGYGVGVVQWLHAAKRGRLSVFMPIIATDGAIAAVIAIVIAGETVGAAAAGGLALVCIGVIAVATPERDASGVRADWGEAPPAVIGALGFGVAFACGGYAAALGIVWTLFVARAVGTVVVFAASGAPRAVPHRTSWPALVMIAACDLGGFAALLLGERQSVAVASVIASQYGVVGSLVGVVLLGERLGLRRIGGVIATGVGVAFVAIG